MIKIFHFKQIDSTSNHAKRLLEKNENCPFFVLSDSQTEGRGSYGKEWLSPEGNLYLTLVIKKTLQRQKMLPLKIGFLLSSWIKDYFNLNVIIKWPNDIFFKNKKIAGILCETHSTSNGEYLCIGIGLNLLKSPKLSTISHYQSHSLSEILETKLNSKECIQSLIQYLDQKRSLLEESSLNESFSNFLPPKNTLWEHIDSKNLFLDHGLDQEGFLRLKPISNINHEIVVNSHSEYKCLMKLQQ